ncbi:MAG: 2-oxoacid:acceptor oxidoreductase subunit alpha [Thermodesulfobacteriota bacterium]
MDCNIRIAGEAGQGVQTTGDLLVGAFARLGLHILSAQSYLSRVRGGVNWYDIRIGDQELFSGREEADLLVALTSDALSILQSALTPEGKVLFDGTGEEADFAYDLTGAAKEAGGSGLMANSVAAGAVFTLLDYGLDALKGYLGDQFRKKGADIIDKNERCVERGAALMQMHRGAVPGPRPGEPRFVTSGTEAVGLSAARSGVKLVCSYPMTPSTGVFTFLANHGRPYGVLVEQAEDEVAAINVICGATYAGVPAMTTTSGGGFALMAEGLSLAGMMELPVLILLGQRPGPATGLPTRTGQQDLRFVIHAGHGEFARAVFAPGTPAQAFDLTRQALLTAHRFQTPVILLLDQFLADMQKTGSRLDDTAAPIDRHLELEPAPDYRRYRLTADGISPRAIPGGPALVVSDSDEHSEDGHITESPSMRRAQQDKRMAKLTGMTAEAVPPEYYGARAARQLLIAWGSTYGPAREAVDLVNADGGRAALLHFSQVWPLRPAAVDEVLAAADVSLRDGVRVTSVEGNCTAQFASLLREHGIFGDCDRILRYDGMPFTANEIAQRLAP